MLGDAGVELADLATTVVVGGAAPAGTVAWDDFLAGADDEARAEVGRRAARARARRPVRHPLHLGHHRDAQGRGADPRPHAACRHRLGGHDRADRRRPLPDGQPVLPHVRAEGRDPGRRCAAGATMLPEAAFDVDRVLARVEAEGVTVLARARPRSTRAILDHPDRDRFDLSTLRVAVTGAADIPVELIRRIADELPFSVVISGYGLTEGGTASATALDDDVETVATTVGRPRPGFELRIVDGDADVAPGETGEVLLRGGSIMSHYLDDPEATAEALTPDGWLRTGDLGTVDADGCLRIVGRSKDMFIVGGFNAYPAEIENGLLAHPDVAAGRRHRRPRRAPRARSAWRSSSSAPAPR